MNNPTDQSTTSRLTVSLVRRTLPAAVATGGAALLMAPIAYWRHGSAGVGVVAVASVVIILAVWLAARLEGSLIAGGHILAGLLAPSAVRMILPLALALMLVTWGRAYLAPHVVLYIVPLYIAMLVVETSVAIQHDGRSSWPSAKVPRPFESASFK